MKLFKTQEQLIAEIHHEFDSAQERLLQEAVTVLNSTAKALPQIAERLEKVGFINTPTAKKGKEVASQLVSSKEQADLIQYYSTSYPFMKFLTEDELNRICEKYTLIHAPVGNYIQEVPEKNLRDIEQAQNLKSFDKEDKRYRFSKNQHSGDEKVLLSALGKTDAIFSQSEIESLMIKHYGHCPVDWCDFESDTFSTTWSYVVSNRIVPGNSVGWGTCEVIKKGGLFIAAPKTHFNLKGLEKKSKHGFFQVFKTEVKDPIVFRYVRGGVQIITKWGLEANDPSLVVPILN
jgi:hypothetical protein